MKILLINKFHYLRGGAERVYFNTAKVLSEHGHDLAFFSMNRPKNVVSRWSKYFIDYVDYQDKKLSFLKKIKVVLKILYNYQAKQNLEKLLREFQPDIAHLHNIYHQLSPSIIDMLKKYQIPMVMTLHDYKLICPNYKIYSKNEVCYKCQGERYYNCFFRKCMKDSYAKSFLVMIEAYLNNKILKLYHKIDLFIVPSHFMEDVCVKFGILENKLRVVNNFVDSSCISNAKVSDKSYLLYFGRLSEEKGIDILLKAMEKIEDNIKLKIVGVGPEEKNLKIKSVKLKVKKNIEFIGYKYGEELNNLIINAKAIIIPSIGLENMPMSMLESMALGKVVIASKIGGISEVIKDGVNGMLFSSGNSDSLATKINQLREININDMEKNAIATIKNFSSEEHYDNIINIYKKLIG
ncbi:MAG: glycosyltransferase family 4 protein [Patescibacteria group bacterium]